MIDVKQRLATLAEKNYKAFNSKLTPGAVEMLGVRIPDLRKLAREISQGDFREFLESSTTRQFEELTLRGLVIATSKMPINERFKYLRIFVSQINNWATCDVVCSTFKPKTAELMDYWKFITQYQDSLAEFELRFMIVMMMDYFLTDEYIDQVLAIANNIRVDKYYTEMAIAWLVATAFVKQRSKTLAFLQNNQLSDFTQNKSIQKIRESYRVASVDKDMLLQWKR